MSLLPANEWFKERAAAGGQLPVGSHGHQPVMPWAARNDWPDIDHLTILDYVVGVVEIDRRGNIPWQKLDGLARA